MLFSFITLAQYPKVSLEINRLSLIPSSVATKFLVAISIIPNFGANFYISKKL